MASSRKRFSVREVIDKLSESDEEHFDDDDSDRDSNYELGDVEPDDDDVEDDDGMSADVADTGDAATSQSHSDAEADAPAVCPQPPSALSSVVWDPVADDYVQQDDFPYTDDTGISSALNLTAESVPIEFVNLFFTEEIMSKIVTETNRYAEQFLHAASLKRKARAHSWSPTNMAEMKQFLGLVFLMGVVKKPCVEDYWSTTRAMATPVFNSTMSRDRFQLLLKFWHFCNNEEMAEGDRLYKLRDICSALISRFQAVYTPRRELSIDESMVLWRGRLIFRQYIPGKRHKYGVKLYLLCETSGYVWNILVYCGKMDPVSGFGHAESVVLNLMSSRLDKGHILFTDNFYTSVPLAKQLLTRKTHVCGTLRRNRKHLPEAVVSRKLSKGETVARRHGNIVVSKWKDKRDVLTLSTLHSGKIANSGKKNRRGDEIMKPDCILDYNAHMCGVDRLDQMLSYYSPLRKTLKWYRKVVLQALDMAVSNGFVLYKQAGGNQPQIWFRTQVIQSLLASQERLAEPSVAPRALVHHKASDLSRLQGQHYMDVIPPTEKKAAPTTKCVVCNKHGRRKETRYVCETCPSKPALCVVQCFKQFHSCADF